ncbi:hypothetical protein GpartN1_g1940.t1 [Galdieria partita]|uniref:Glycosyltransferase 2-like domain-containing protein n=1 Tax=Galdieria partita TaxID=83374 RepID=A0A9C7UNS2_9RHOD|nr:hypothetical protein GpartN1_g1925.t1 [Galdieria partita]GJQ10149.1 hypothetical protein GpartN1_g1940.t1 [Galdieria partita]
MYYPEKRKKMEPKVALCMIVRDEETNMVQSLDSALKFVDAAVITDTGSKDRTKSIIFDYFENHPEIPLYFSETKFVDFSQARNFNYEQAKRSLPKGFHWFGFQMDADDEVVVADDFDRREICVAGKKILITLSRNSVVMTYIAVFDLELAFKYIMPVHEMPVFERNDLSSVSIPPERIRLISRHNGYRSKYADKNKEIEDMLRYSSMLPEETLEKAISIHRLATMCSDVNDHEKARNFFKMYLEHPLSMKFSSLHCLALQRYAAYLVALDEKMLKGLHYAFLCIYMYPSYLEAYSVVAWIGSRLQMPALVTMACTCGLMMYMKRETRWTAERDTVPGILLKFASSVNESRRLPTLRFEETLFFEQIRKHS